MSAWLLGLLVLGQSGDLQTPDVVTNIQSLGIRNVAVCPHVLSRDPVTGEESFAALGPQGRKDSENLYRALQACASQYGFKLVNPIKVQEVFRKSKFAYADLGDERRQQALASSLGADGLVVMKDTGDSEGWRIDVNVLGTNNLAMGGPSTMLTPQRGLSDAAFAGQSFEVRRWSGDSLVPVGFQKELSPLDSVGMGLDYELRQYAQLRTDRPHPLKDPEFPFGIAIRVSGPAGENPQVREIEWIGSQPYIRLDPEEHFAVMLPNRSTRNTLMALYIDGINSISSQQTEVFESPLQTPPNRRWAIAPTQEKVAAITGWTKIIPGQASQLLHRFRIAPREESVAFGQSVTDNFGMITVVIYTNGIRDIKPSPRDVPKDEFKGTGLYAVARARESEQQQLTFKSAEAGLMLAAITLNYRSGAELEELRRTSLQLAKNNGGTSTGGTSTGGTSTGGTSTGGTSTGGTSTGGTSTGGTSTGGTSTGGTSTGGTTTGGGKSNGLSGTTTEGGGKKSNGEEHPYIPERVKAQSGPGEAVPYVAPKKGELKSVKS